MSSAGEAAETGGVPQITECPSQREINPLLSVYNAGDLKLAVELAERIRQTFPSHPFG